MIHSNATFLKKILSYFEKHRSGKKFALTKERGRFNSAICFKISVMTDSLSKEILLKQYGSVIEPYVGVIVDIYKRHRQRHRQLVNSDDATTTNNVAISTSSNDVTFSIEGSVFVEYTTLATFRDEIRDFDKLCVNVEVDFQQQVTNYTLSTGSDVDCNQKPHYFYNTRPFFRSSALQESLQDHIQLCTRNNNLHDLSKRVIQCYIYHCSKVPRFSVYEEKPDEDTMIVSISGIESLNAHFVTHLSNLLHTHNITAWVPKCNPELRCEFHLKALKKDALNAKPSSAKKRKFFGLF